MDEEAEAAVRGAFTHGIPYNSHTIPDRARKILNDLNNGPARIHRAIKDMSDRGELFAPIDPSVEWQLSQSSNSSSPNLN